MSRFTATTYTLCYIDLFVISVTKHIYLKNIWSWYLHIVTPFFLNYKLAETHDLLSKCQYFSAFSLQPTLPTSQMNAPKTLLWPQCSGTSTVCLSPWCQVSGLLSFPHPTIWALFSRSHCLASRTEASSQGSTHCRHKRHWKLNNQDQSLLHVYF